MFKVVYEYVVVLVAESLYLNIERLIRRLFRITLFVSKFDCGDSVLFSKFDYGNSH